MVVLPYPSQVNNRQENQQNHAGYPWSCSALHQHLSDRATARTSCLTGVSPCAASLRWCQSNLTWIGLQCIFSRWGWHFDSPLGLHPFPVISHVQSVTAAYSFAYYISPFTCPFTCSATASTVHYMHGRLKAGPTVIVECNHIAHCKCTNLPKLHLLHTTTHLRKTFIASMYKQTWPEPVVKKIWAQSV